MFNPVIVIVILIQAFISRVSLLAGAVVGYLITTGILIWGMSVYSEGDQIAFFGIGLSQPVFIIACLVWYAFDTWSFISAMKATKAAKKLKESIKQLLESPLMKEEHVVRFYQTTREAWASGRLSKISGDYKKEGKKSLEYIMANYAPLYESALWVFFDKFKPLPGEFLITQGNVATETQSGWCILTNLRLIQRTGLNFEFRAIMLADIQKFQIKTGKTITFVLGMKSGEVITYNDLLMCPVEKQLTTAIKMQMA